MKQNRSPSSNTRGSKSNTLADLLSEEVKKQLKYAVKRKDSDKQDKRKTTKDK